MLHIYIIDTQNRGGYILHSGIQHGDIVRTIYAKQGTLLIQEGSPNIETNVLTYKKVSAIISKSNIWELPPIKLEIFFGTSINLMKIDEENFMIDSFSLLCKAICNLIGFTITMYKKKLMRSMGSTLSPQ